MSTCYGILEMRCKYNVQRFLPCYWDEAEFPDLLMAVHEYNYDVNKRGIPDSCLGFYQLVNDDDIFFDEHTYEINTANIPKKLCTVSANVGMNDQPGSISWERYYHFYWPWSAEPLPNWGSYDNKAHLDRFAPFIPFCCGGAVPPGSFYTGNYKNLKVTRKNV